MLSVVVKSKEDTLAIAIINPFSKKQTLIYLLLPIFSQFEIVQIQNFRLDCTIKINNNDRVSGCPRGGMVDTRDLKSLGLIGRASSSLAVGTR